MAADEWEIVEDEEGVVTNDVFTAEVIDGDAGQSVVIKFTSGITVLVRGAMATPGNVIIETYGKVLNIKGAQNAKPTDGLGDRVTAYEVKQR